LKLLKEDQSHFWAQLESIAVTAVDIALNGRQFNTAITDINDRKQAEDALCNALELRESELKYATLVEDALMGVYIIQDSKIEFANKKFADIYGYAKDELI
jgi:two-component system sporulation sensor kinase A